MEDKKEVDVLFDTSTSLISSDSEAIRTLDPRLRRALLNPAELRNHP